MGKTIELMAAHDDAPAAARCLRRSHSAKMSGQVVRTFQLVLPPRGSLSGQVVHVSIAYCRHVAG